MAVIPDSIKWNVSTFFAKVYQELGWRGWIPDSLKDLLAYLNRITCPIPCDDDEVPVTMVEVIRERMGLSKEEFGERLANLRADEEREKLGLPKK